MYDDVISDYIIRSFVVVVSANVVKTVRVAACVKLTVPF